MGFDLMGKKLDVGELTTGKLNGLALSKQPTGNPTGYSLSATSATTANYIRPQAAAVLANLSDSVILPFYRQPNETQFESLRLNTDANWSPMSIFLVRSSVASSVAPHL